MFKGGDMSDKSNYLPISILPVISRFFEKCIADQLYQYMTENNVFHHINLAFSVFIPL